MIIAINELTEEYKQKQDNCDILITASSERIRLLRKTKQPTASERQDRAILLAQKQAYVQAEYDIDSLIDSIKDKS